MKLTTQEQTALAHARVSSAANGHDFGFVEDIVIAMRPMKPQAAGAVVTSLVKKGVLTVHDKVTTDAGTFTQFTLSEGGGA